jgi:hypothetical protein
VIYHHDRLPSTTPPGGGDLTVDHHLSTAGHANTGGTASFVFALLQATGGMAPQHSFYDHHQPERRHRQRHLDPQPDGDDYADVLRASMPTPSPVNTGGALSRDLHQRHLKRCGGLCRTLRR